MRSLFWTCLVNKVLFSTSMILVRLLPNVAFVDNYDILAYHTCVHQTGPEKGYHYEFGTRLLEITLHVFSILPSYWKYDKLTAFNKYDIVFDHARFQNKMSKALYPATMICVVWYGMAWCGVVWCGMARCGMMWHGVVWCGLVWSGMFWCGLVWFGVLMEMRLCRNRPPTRAPETWYGAIGR